MHMVASARQQNVEPKASMYLCHMDGMDAMSESKSIPQLCSMQLGAECTYCSVIRLSPLFSSTPNRMKKATCSSSQHSKNMNYDRLTWMVSTLGNGCLQLQIFVVFVIPCVTPSQHPSVVPICKAATYRHLRQKFETNSRSKNLSRMASHANVNDDGLHIGYSSTRTLNCCNLQTAPHVQDYFCLGNWHPYGRHNR